MSKFLWSLGSGLLLTFSVFSTGVASAAKTDGAPQARSVAEHTSADASILPRAQASFQGKIGRTYKDSEPDWSRPVQAPVGAPNVLLVLTDDVGFGASSTFGGLVPTPNLDQLADNGVRYNRFHTTAICSPTRASLLTGRNHHAVGVGIVADLAAGYPGYDGYMPRSAATVAEVLKLNGYNTAMFGKHHNVPAGASSTAGPFDQWPVGLGFEYFYGFVGAQANQFSPPLYRGTNPIEAPEGVMLDQALIDDAINWVHNQRASAPEKPFFIYYAPVPRMLRIKRRGNGSKSFVVGSTKAGIRRGRRHSSGRKSLA